MDFQLNFNNRIDKEFKRNANKININNKGKKYDAI
jgi:hypothetical protein